MKMQSPSDRVVKLNVGGTGFSTSKLTLAKEPASRLHQIASGALTCVRDEHGVFFLDRDPKHFQLLLNWMRDGWCALPAASLERMEIAAEAEAYSLHGMLAWLKTQPGAVHSPGLGPRSSPGYAPANPRPYSASANASPRVTYTAYSSPPPSAPQYHQQPQLSPGSPQPRSYTSYTSPRSPGTDPAAGIGSAGVLGLREAFRRATAPAPVTTHIPSPRQTQAEERAQGVAAVPAAPGSSGKWTSKCLQTNDALRTAVNALLELAFIAPHHSLHYGKISIHITSACDHDRSSGILGGAGHLRNRLQTVRVRGLTTGYAMEFPIKPGCDITLYEKYGELAGFVQDNWFLMCAVMREQFGVLLEEEAPPGATLPVPVRPGCQLCKRTQLAVTMHKIV